MQRRGESGIRWIVRRTLTIKRARSTVELKQAFAIRLRVFVREQGVPAEIELDRDDAKAIHFLALDSGKAIGTARIVLHRNSAKIGRMAVLKSRRRSGVGTRLLQHALATARRLGAKQVYLHAQIAVLPFYRRLGFRAAGAVFDEAGIAHRKMILEKGNRQQARGNSK